MELNNYDIIVLIYIEKHTLSNINRISFDLSIDKSNIYKIIRKLAGLELINYSNSRPREYIVNDLKFKEWKNKK